MTPAEREMMRARLWRVLYDALSPNYEIESEGYAQATDAIIRRFDLTERGA